MMLFPDVLRTQAAFVLDTCRKAGVRVATAESCTGGLIGAVLTEIPGASAVIDRGFITYSNDAKIALLDVPVDLLDTCGAVSEPVARAMAEGVLVRCPAVHLAIGVTGIAGPDGGSPTRPVGLVHIAVARRGGSTLHQKAVFPGERTAVRLATVAAALALLAAGVRGDAEG
ncbi:MAG: cinA [Rhodospirillaceae bacterium]|nr:MAG: cinA [Rhodospirillaceae bacterium]